MSSTFHVLSHWICTTGHYIDIIFYIYFFASDKMSAILSNLLKVWTQVWTTPNMFLSDSMSITLHLNLFIVFNFQAFDLKFLSSFGEFSTLEVLVRNTAFLPLYKLKIPDPLFTLLLSFRYRWATVRWPRIGQLHPCSRFWIRKKWCEEAGTAVPGSASCVLFLPGRQGKLGHNFSTIALVYGCFVGF